MKKIISFVLLLAACDAEDDLSKPPHDEAEQVSEVKEESSEGEGETNTHTDTHTPMQENVSNQYFNDLLIRLEACVFIPRCFDVNPVTGEQVCTIKWRCPPGFR
jgi:hypothetical protein